MKKKIMVVFIFALVFIAINTITSNAGEQRLNNMEFNVNVKENGDMLITEIWDIYINETNTLFKTFPLDGSYNSITDVQVAEIKNGNEYNFSKANSYEYHVKKDYFQALENPEREFEIAWGVGLDNSSATRKYVITYNVKNHVTLYNDGAEIYWQLIGSRFDVPISKIKGTINIPNGIENKEDLKVWAHGPLNGSINIENVGQVSFSVDDLRKKDFLEIRILMPTNIFKTSSKIKNDNIVEKTIKEETVWANEANELREREAKKQGNIKTVATITAIVLIIGNIVLTLKLTDKVKQTEKKKPEQELKYFRDITNKNSSPAQVAFLHYFSKGKVMGNVGKVISGTILSLTLKSWVEIEVDEKKKITFRFKENGKELTESEKQVLEFLKSATKGGVLKIFKGLIDKEKTEDKNELKLKELENYIKSNYTSTHKLMEELSKSGEKENVKCKNFDLELKKEGDKWVGAITGYSILALLASFIIGFCGLGVLFLILICTVIINIVMLSIIVSRKNGLTQSRNK